MAKTKRKSVRPKVLSFSVRVGLGKSGIKLVRSDVKKTVKGLEAKFTKRLNDYFRRNFGMSDFYKRWKADGFQATKEELSTKFVSSLSTNTKYQRPLLNLYAKAWKNKYQDTINKYRKADPQYTAKPYRAHYAMKRKAVKGDAKMSRGSGRRIKYTTWGLASGYLRDSIFRGFKGGMSGSGPVKVSSLAVQGAYSVNWDYFPVAANDNKAGLPYAVRFMNHLINLEVIDNYEDFIDFLPGDWDEISKYIMGLLSTDFTEIMREAFKSLPSEQKP